MWLGQPPSSNPCNSLFFISKIVGFPIFPPVSDRRRGLGGGLWTAAGSGTIISANCRSSHWNNFSIQYCQLRLSMSHAQYVDIALLANISLLPLPVFDSLLGFLLREHVLGLNCYRRKSQFSNLKSPGTSCGCTSTRRKMYLYQPASPLKQSLPFICQKRRSCIHLLLIGENRIANYSTYSL